MILCNQCGAVAEDGLRFCTECGTELLSVSRPGSNSPFKTQVLTPGSEVIRINTPAQRPQPSTRPFVGSAATNVKPTRSTTRVIGLTAAITAVVLGLVEIAGWMFFASKKDITPISSATRPPAEPNGTNNLSNSSNVGKTADTPPVQSITNNAQPPVIVNQPGNTVGILSVLNDWTAATRAHDFQRHMSYYANVLDIYYGRKNVGIDAVRANRIRAFERYSTLDVQLSQIVVNVDGTNNHATATFDKNWNFAGEKSFSGSVHQIVWLTRFDGRWLITGEKDLENYQR